MFTGPRSYQKKQRYNVTTLSVIPLVSRSREISAELAINRRKTAVGPRNRLTFHVMALSRSPFVNLSRAYYRLDSLLTRYTRSVYPRSNRTLTILLLYSPPSVETRSRDNGRLTIFPVLQIPRGPFRAGRRSKEWYLSMHSISLFSDGLTRSWPHQESTQNSSNGGYRFEHVAENSKRREPRG